MILSTAGSRGGEKRSDAGRILQTELMIFANKMDF